MRHRATLFVLVAACVVFPGRALAGALFVIKGAGWGNGIGMSQWGAEGYALHGWNYERILAHYYPHTTLGHWSEPPVRVELAEGKPSVRVGSSAPFLLVDARGRKVHVPARTLAFGAPLRMGAHALVPPVEARPGAQPLSFEGNAYRGSFTLLRSGGGLTVVNVVPLELYVRGVVPSEMPRGWRLPAYEAQAVAARSFVLASLRSDRPFDVYGDPRSQRYGGVAAETPQTNAAVGNTTGQVVTYEGHPVTAYYDSDAGGRTAAVEDVFAGGTPRPYLVSVSDPYDAASPYRHWRVALSSDDLSARLGVAVDDVRVEHMPSGVAGRVVLVGAHARQALAAADFERRLGLRSLRFSVAVISLAAGKALELHGFVRGIGGVVLQRREANGSWWQVMHVRARPDGRFTVSVRNPGAYRLAVDGIAGPPLQVAGRR